MAKPLATASRTTGQAAAGSKASEALRQATDGLSEPVRREIVDIAARERSWSPSKSPS